MSPLKTPEGIDFKEFIFMFVNMTRKTIHKNANKLERLFRLEKALEGSVVRLLPLREKEV